MSIVYYFPVGMFLWQRSKNTVNPENIKNSWKNNKNLILQICSIMYKNLPGDYCESVIPDPIPNSEVKPFSANGTLS